MNRLVFFFSVIVLLFTLTQRVYAAEHEATGEDGSNASHPEFAYIQLDPISIPIITAKGLTQQVRLMVSLEIPFEQKEAVDVYKPRLADAYIQDLYGAIGAGHALMNGNIVDVAQIKQRLTAITDKVLGPDLKANGVLLQVVQQRSM